MAREAISSPRLRSARPSRNVAIGLVGAVGGAVVLGMSGALAQPSIPEISCTAATVYGQSIDCLVSGADETKTSIDWGDGEVTPASAISYSPKAVGVVSISLIDNDEVILATSEVQVTPDLKLHCESGDTATVFELVASPASESGWDYVYTDLETGMSVYPGDANYPEGFNLTGFERVAAEEASVTGKCTATSQAGDDLDGDFAMTMTSEWEEARSVPFGYIVPWTSHHWAGTQPGELEATVTVDGLEASERVGIYFSGCG